MEASLPKYPQNAYIYSSMAGGPIEKLIEATSLEGFWPQKKFLLKKFRGLLQILT
jgi:hypothetical protein